MKIGFYVSYPYFIDIKDKKDTRRLLDEWNLYFKIEEEEYILMQKYMD